MASIADFFANPDLLKTWGGVDGAEYFNPFSGEASAGYQSMFDKGYTLAQDPNIWGSMKEGNFQTDPSQVVKDPTTGMLFYPGKDIGGAWEKRDVADQGWGNPMTAATILALSIGATAPFWAPAAFGSGAGAGAAGGEAAAGAAEGLSAIGPAQGSVLPAGLQASGAMTFPVANPYAGIELLGAGALGGSGAEMLNQLIYSDIGPAQGEILGAGLQESGAMVNPVTANPYAGITATPTNSLWDLAKKIPSMPSMPGGGAQTQGGDGGDGMSLWSNTVNQYAYAPPSTGTPIYQAHEATPYAFEDELQKRLALIRGAR